MLDLKKDGTVRTCGEYKLSVNQAFKVDSYPLPRINDLFCLIGRRENVYKTGYG